MISIGFFVDSDGNEELYREDRPINYKNTIAVNTVLSRISPFVFILNNRIGILHLNFSNSKLKP